MVSFLTSGALLAWQLLAAPDVTGLVAATAPTRLPDAQVEGELPPPKAEVTVVPGASDTWTLRIKNADVLPIVLVADPRLLSLEFASPDPKKEPVRCTLPPEMRPPSDDPARIITLAPGKTYRATFDVRLYCFTGPQRAALRSGGLMQAQFGWDPPATGRASAPYVASNVAGLPRMFTPLKVLLSPWSRLPKRSVQTDLPLPAEWRLEVSLPSELDAVRYPEMNVDLQVMNHGATPLTLRLKPDTVGFLVTPPKATSPTVRCGQQTYLGTPIPEAFATIRPGGRASVAVRVSAICPLGTFDDAGVYLVTPILDTRRASGAAIGLKTWEGELPATKAMWLRVPASRRTSAPESPEIE